MMDFKQRYKEFNKRFGIAEAELKPDVEFDKFRQRVLNILDDIDFKIKTDGIVRFCTWFAIPVKKSNGYVQHGRNILNKFANTKDESDFFFLIQELFSLFPEYEDRGYHGHNHEAQLYRDIEEAFLISDISASIALVKNKDRSYKKDVIVYPRGEEVLDKGLIEEVFSFLDSKSQQHFVAAVKAYKTGIKTEYIKSAESIRRSLEEYLRYKLNSAKGLDKNLKVLLEEFKKVKTSAQIKSIVHQALSYLDGYFNEHSKHKDGDIGEAECEFLLYQSGLLMRYISKVL